MTRQMRLRRDRAAAADGRVEGEGHVIAEVNEAQA
jgi:hypothetical protein